MTQEDKELLLKDLAQRLPYWVMIHITDDENHLIADEELYCINICQEALYTRNREFHAASSLVPIEYCKPYLRPMSSMTEEEWEYLRLLKNELVECDETNDEKFNKILNDIKEFYYSRHIDRNGIIPKGLALEAPKDMYNLKEK